MIKSVFFKGNSLGNVRVNLKRRGVVAWKKADTIIVMTRGGMS